VERRELEPGTTGTAVQTVTPEDLASSLAVDPGDEFPAVFATARMVALMELAASRALASLLEPGELSVGVTVDITHSAPTPVGATVTATARFLEREGKLYRFEVTAEDHAGEVGRGTHRRAIVAAERLVAGAERRKPQPGPVP
jgi:fluoroacetyl-CoA thioesterase